MSVTLEQVAAWLALATDDELTQALNLAWPDEPLTDIQEN